MNGEHGDDSNATPKNDESAAERAFALYLAAATKEGGASSASFRAALSDVREQAEFDRLVEVFDRYRRSLIADGAEPEIASTLPLRRIGGFEIQGLLGRGGMGVVYRARQVALGREVALKVIAESLGTADGSRRFQSEMRAIAKLSHPNIVPILECGEVDGVAYYAMPLLDGGSVQSRLDALNGLGEIGFAPAEAVAIALAISDALVVAHGAGIVHRDIKPSNVVFDSWGKPLLIDFGLARDTSVADATRSQEVMGTLRFSAPERLLRKEADDVRIDVFGLGATLYAMLTGRSPWDGDTDADVLHALQLEDPAPVHRWNTRVPADVDTVCAMAVQRNPDQRYTSMVAFAQDLRNLLEFRPIAAKPASLATKLVKLVRRHRAFVASAVAVVVVAVTGVLLGQACSKPPIATRDPVGSVRIGIEDDTITEFRDINGTSVAWRQATRQSPGAVELPPGKYEMRVQRRNHFPVLAENIVAVADRQEAVVAIRRPQPIERWSVALQVGASKAGPQIIVDGSGAKRIALKRVGALSVYEAHSGRTATDFPFHAEHSSAWAVLAGGSKEPVFRLVGLSNVQGKSTLFRADVAGEVLRYYEPEELESEVDHFVVVPDIDDDGVDDVVIALEDGALLKYSPERSIVSWRREGAGQPLVRLVHVPESDSPGIAAWVAAVYENGRIEAIATRDGTSLGECNASFVPRHCAPLKLGSEHVLVLTGEHGIHIADPTGTKSVRRISEHDAVDVAAGNLVGSADADEEIVVFGNGRLFVLDARDGRERWNFGLSVGWGTLSIGELDARAGAEIVLAESNGVVRAFAGTDGSESWRFQTAGAFGLPPLIDDLDGDGLGEVIVISTDERMHVLSGSAEYRIWTHETLWPIGTRPVVATGPDGTPILVIGTSGTADRFPFNGAMWGTAVHGIVAKTGEKAWPPVRAEQSFLWSPELADLDADGAIDSFAIDRVGRLVGIRASDGRKILNVAIDPPKELAPIRPWIAELDASDGAEMLTVRIRGDRPFLEACTGTRATTTWSRELSAPAIAIVARAYDRDVRSAVACGMRGGRVLVLDGATGAELAALTPGGGSKSALKFGDVTGDALDDLVVAIHDEGAATPSAEMVKVYDGATWELLWSAKKADSSMGVEAIPAIADVDGDGQSEVVIGDWEGRLYVFAGNDGTPWWEGPVKVGRAGYFATPAIGDLDGDRASEIVVGGLDRFVTIVDGRTGRVLRRCGVGSEIFGTPLLMDVDGNGSLEIVIGSDEGRLHAIPGTVSLHR